MKIISKNVSEEWHKILIDEYQILIDRLNKLNKKLALDEFKAMVGEKQFELMEKQSEGMTIYANALKERMIALKLVED